MGVLDFAIYLESTSVALSATLGYLAIHQDHQEKVYSEIKEVVHDREPVRILPDIGILASLIRRAHKVLEDMSRVPHLQACFKESLRLFRAFRHKDRLD